jgi:hypothetical protein
MAGPDVHHRDVGTFDEYQALFVVTAVRRGVSTRPRARAFESAHPNAWD